MCFLSKSAGLENWRRDLFWGKSRPCFEEMFIVLSASLSQHRKKKKKERVTHARGLYWRLGSERSWVTRSWPRETILLFFSFHSTLQESGHLWSSVLSDWEGGQGGTCLPGDIFTKQEPCALLCFLCFSKRGSDWAQPGQVASASFK